MNIDIDLGYQGNVVVFDLDDTLYKECDYVASAYNAIDKYMSEHYNIQSKECFATMENAFKNKANPFDKLFEMLSTQYPDTKADLDTLLKIYRYHTPDIQLDQTTRNLLLSLQANRVRMGIITDGRSLSQRNKINALGITQFFSPQDIIISEEIGFDKNSIEPFTHFVHRYPNAKGFVYIGDNPEKDFYYPNILGWKTICIKDDGRNIHSQNIDFPIEKLPNISVMSIIDVLPLL